MRRALVLGAGGFIGSHMVTRLKNEGFWVRGVDLKYPEYSKTTADEFFILDLRLRDSAVRSLTLDTKDEHFDHVYQYAADMGGAGYIFTGENDADVMFNSASINLNILQTLAEFKIQSGSSETKIFYSSSACIYPEQNQLDPDNPHCEEESAYPANPDSEYGWEKLFSERLFFAFNRNYQIPIAVARFHNIFGPEGTWDGGKEKSPAAICRKVAKLPSVGGTIEMWGDGKQTRSFLFVDECVEATRRLMDSDFQGPVNIGSEEMVTINELVDIVGTIANKTFSRSYKLDAPTGVRGRNSSNVLIREKLGWDFELTLEQGLSRTYDWIREQIELQVTRDEG